MRFAWAFALIAVMFASAARSDEVRIPCKDQLDRASTDLMDDARDIDTLGKSLKGTDEESALLLASFALEGDSLVRNASDIVFLGQFLPRSASRPREYAAKRLAQLVTLLESLAEQTVTDSHDASLANLSSTLRAHLRNTVSMMRTGCK